MSILPVPHGIGHPTSSVNWRDWITDPNPIPDWMEVWAATGTVLDRLVDQAGHSGHKWGELIDRITTVPVELQTRILNPLVNLDIQSLADDDIATIKNRLRHLLSNHQFFTGADMTLQQPQLDTVTFLYKRYEPTDLLLKYAWLFGSTVRLPEISTDNWREQEQAISIARKAAVDDIYSKRGYQAIFELANISEEPWIVGFVLGKCVVPTNDLQILAEVVASESRSTELFTRGYVSGCFETSGISWSDRLVSGPTWERFTSKQKAEVLLCLPQQQSTWNYVQKSGEEIERYYWTNNNSFIRDDCRYAIEQLLRYDRPYTVMHVLKYCREPLDERLELITRVLDQAMKSNEPLDTIVTTVGQDIGDLLDVLAEAHDLYEDRISTYEWFFMPLLTHVRQPKTLHLEMANNPEFFAQLLEFAFKARSGEAQTSSKDDAARAHSAYELLTSWRRNPGISDDGSVDAEKLYNWITRARALYTASDRREIGDQFVGQMLSAAPSASDGVWPAEFARDIIESVASEDIETGVSIGTINSRGTTWRSPYDGGAQELALAAKYRQDAGILSNRWPRTAGVLRSIAQNYEAQARVEDVEAELNEDL